MLALQCNHHPHTYPDPHMFRRVMDCLMRVHGLQLLVDGVISSSTTLSVSLCLYHTESDTLTLCFSVCITPNLTL